MAPCYGLKSNKSYAYLLALNISGILVYKDKGEDIPYTFIEDRSIVMGQLVESPISEAHSIVRENLSKL